MMAALALVCRGGVAWCDRPSVVPRNLCVSRTCTPMCTHARTHAHTYLHHGHPDPRLAPSGDAPSRSAPFPWRSAAAAATRCRTSRAAAGCANRSVWHHDGPRLRGGRRRRWLPRARRPGGSWVARSVLRLKRRAGWVVALRWWRRPRRRRRRPLECPFRPAGLSITRGPTAHLRAGRGIVHCSHAARHRHPWCASGHAASDGIVSQVATVRHQRGAGGLCHRQSLVERRLYHRHEPTACCAGEHMIQRIHLGTALVAPPLLDARARRRLPQPATGRGSGADVCRGCRACGGGGGGSSSGRLPQTSRGHAFGRRWTHPGILHLVSRGAPPAAAGTAVGADLAAWPSLHGIAIHLPPPYAAAPGYLDCAASTLE
jgi:hypothetical protein